LIVYLLFAFDLKAFIMAYDRFHVVLPLLFLHVTR